MSKKRSVASDVCRKYEFNSVLVLDCTDEHVYVRTDMGVPYVLVSSTVTSSTICYIDLFVFSF